MAEPHESRGPTDGTEGAAVDVLAKDEETLVVAFRRHTLLLLDDCLYGPQATVPHLTRSALHRLLQRHGISRLPSVESSPRLACRGDPTDARRPVPVPSPRLDLACAQLGIDHRLAKFNYPRTNGHVERMNRSIKDATVRRFYYETHSSLRTHLATFLDGYNFAKRLKSLRGLTPFERICQLWTEQPERFRLNPLHHMAGLNI